MEITIGGNTYTGVKKLENGEIVCEKCGSDEANRTMHADATDFYLNVLTCKCGNAITIKTMRTGENRKLWEDGE